MSPRRDAPWWRVCQVHPEIGNPEMGTERMSEPVLHEYARGSGKVNTDALDGVDAASMAAVGRSLDMTTPSWIG